MLSSFKPSAGWGSGLFLREKSTQFKIPPPPMYKTEKTHTLVNIRVLLSANIYNYDENLISPWTCSTKDSSLNHFWGVVDNTGTFLGDKLLSKPRFAFLEFYQNVTVYSKFQPESHLLSWLSWRDDTISCLWENLDISTVMVHQRLLQTKSKRSNNGEDWGELLFRALEQPPGSVQAGVYEYFATALRKADVC